MHKRHRSPSDGAKSNSAGMRLSSGRRSPDGSLRGHRTYNSEHRSFNKRRFRRGPGKHYPPLRQSPPRGDIFMEAGRLAAEYLVSQGLLPPTLLNGKLQNGNLKGQMGDPHGFSVQDRDGSLPPPEVRTSALARLGNMIPDTGPRRRKSLDEFNPLGSRSHGGGRRSTGNLRGYGFDWSRENRRNGSFSEKGRAFPDMEEAEDEFAGGYRRVRRAKSDVGGRAPKFTTDEPSSKKEIAGNLESKLEKFGLPDDAGCKEISSNTQSDLPIDTYVVSNKVSDDAKISSSLNEGVKDHKAFNEKMENEKAQEELGKQQVSLKDEELSKKYGDNCQDLCRFAKVSAETDSLLVDQGPSTQGSNIRDNPLAGGSRLSVEEDSVEGFSSNLQASLTHSSKCPVSDISIFPSFHSVDEAQNMDMDTEIVVRSEICQRSQSFSDRSPLIREQESNQPPGFERCRSMVEQKESLVQHPGTTGGTKRSREWPSPIVSQPDELSLQDLRAKQICKQVEKISPGEEMVKTADKEEEDGDLSPKCKTDSSLESKEEKQDLPSFFKICDLNLTDASEIAESPEGHFEYDVPTGASALGVEKQTSSDVGPSICNGNFGSTHTNDGCSSDAKEVSGIDATNDSVMEDKIFATSEQKTEPTFSSSESFPNQTESAVDLAGVPDGYSLGISELFGTDIPNCSSGLPSDVNDLHTGMPLQNQEGILCEDDPIYLALGEIPLGFMGAWDQPNQDYGKPF